MSRFPARPLLFLTICLCTLGTRPCQARTLPVSDLLSPSIAASLPEGMNCESQGSIEMLEGLQNGSVELAICAIPTDQELPEGLIAIPLAYEVASLVVSKSNPLDIISLTDLARLFGTPTGTQAPQWGELGLGGAWNERRIQSLLTETETPVPAQLFRHIALKDGAFNPTLKSLPIHDLEQTLREQEGVVALIQGPQAPQSGKVLALSTSNGANVYAYRPEPQSLFFGDYPLSLPFYILLPKDATSEAQDCAKALLQSHALAKALKGAGFVTVPQSEQDPSLYFGQ